MLRNDDEEEDGGEYDDNNDEEEEEADDDCEDYDGVEVLDDGELPSLRRAGSGGGGGGGRREGAKPGRVGRSLASRHRWCEDWGERRSRAYG